jgi:hypothetical protein
MNKKVKYNLLLIIISIPILIFLYWFPKNCKYQIQHIYLKYALRYKSVYTLDDLKIKIPSNWLFDVASNKLTPFMITEGCRPIGRIVFTEISDKQKEVYLGYFNNKTKYLDNFNFIGLNNNIKIMAVKMLKKNSDTQSYIIPEKKIMLIFHSSKKELLNLANSNIDSKIGNILNSIIEYDKMHNMM